MKVKKYETEIFSYALQRSTNWSQMRFGYRAIIHSRFIKTEFK